MLKFNSLSFVFANASISVAVVKAGWGSRSADPVLAMGGSQSSSHHPGYAFIGLLCNIDDDYPCPQDR